MPDNNKNSRLLLFLWLGSICVISITFLLIYYGLNPGDSQVALHYNVILGVDLFGTGTELYKLPIIGFIVISINGLLSAVLKVFEPIFQIILASSSLVISVVLLFATLLLFNVN